MQHNTVPHREMARQAFVATLINLIIHESSRRGSYIDAQRDFCGVMLAYLNDRENELIGGMAVFVDTEIIPRINRRFHTDSERLGIIAALFEWSARTIAQCSRHRMRVSGVRIMWE